MSQTWSEKLESAYKVFFFLEQLVILVASY